MTDLERFDCFVKLMKETYPKLTIAYKNESKLMWLMSKALFFNREFMTSYVTTIGSTVYFVSREKVEHDPISAMNTLAHECVHLEDAKRFSILFSLLYLCPQILALLVVPALFFLGLYGLILLLFLAPIPSPGRMYFERRGYSMTLFAYDYRLREIGLPHEDRLALLRTRAKHITNTYFKGAAYYFMWPFNLDNYFDATIKSIDSGDILHYDKVFRTVKAALDESKSCS